MKILSLFSGIGAFEAALRNIGADFELVNYCEIDKFASSSYAQIHNVSESLNLHDVTAVDPSEIGRCSAVFNSVDGLGRRSYPCISTFCRAVPHPQIDVAGMLAADGLFRF